MTVRRVAGSGESAFSVLGCGDFDRVFAEGGGGIALGLAPNQDSAWALCSAFCLHGDPLGQLHIVDSSCPLQGGNEMNASFSPSAIG